jgi:LysM repeat protein
VDHEPLHLEFVAFLKALVSYFASRLAFAGLHFEKIKDFIVDALISKRGANTPLFLHASILTLALAVLVGGGVLTSTTVVSGSYPGVPANPLVAGAVDNLESGGVISSSVTPVTVISDKPRDKTLEYEVKEGETVSSVAGEYGVSESTILWENDLLATDTIAAGQKLRILPVSGVSHKVVSGDTIYSVAKKYQANPQAVIDFPFNDIGDNFALLTGQELIVPEGAPPEKPKPAPTKHSGCRFRDDPVYLAGFRGYFPVLFVVSPCY